MANGLVDADGDTAVHRDLGDGGFGDGILHQPVNGAGGESVLVAGQVVGGDHSVSCPFSALTKVCSNASSLPG
ncbi:hypothetical protein [Lawsonella clevelandensis]|uniref:hypothetical protein n=1 Tax=Lawsonella clevelandensis TaxID=1528099 RepID=UPI0027B91255|nr:hypothetical protein [Lawsonella clevelandensis]